MKYAGAGAVPAGNYNEPIEIAGSGHIRGDIHCTGLTCAGATKSDGSIECAGKIRIAGSFTVKGDVRADNQIEVAGAAKISGKVRGEAVDCAGLLRTGGGIEAETLRLRGELDCGGLLNAESADITFNTDSRAVSIGGGKIHIVLGDKARKQAWCGRLPLLGRLFSKAAYSEAFKVDEAIEGDTVTIEHVHAPVVSGRVVTIGAGCEIGTVRYSEEIKIAPDTRVGRTEKDA